MILRLFKPFSDQVEEAFKLFGYSLDSHNIAANTSGSNCDYEAFDEDKLLSNFDAGYGSMG